MAEQQTTKRRRGRPPREPQASVPIQDTPEFKLAVAEAAAKATADILATLQASQGGVTKPGDANFAEGLALAIAQLSHQGTGRAKPVDPAVLKAREDARGRMFDRIIQARKDGQVPVYELRNKVYLDEVLVDPVYVDPATKEQRPTQIEWPGVPSEAMKPANDVAAAIYQEFSGSIGVVVVDHSKHLKPEHFGVTAGGLVVRGTGHALRPMQTGDGRGPPEASGEGLRVVGRGNQGRQKEIRVLGTVAQPARVGPNG